MCICVSAFFLVPEAVPMSAPEGVTGGGGSVGVLTIQWQVRVSVIINSTCSRVVKKMALN